MRYREWSVLFIIVGLGIALANFVGFRVAFTESIPGVVILLAISLASVTIHKIVPLRLPIVAYCSLLGLLVACPLSPVSSYVIEAVDKINFTAPLTMVGAFAGILISDQLRTFIRQGWKMIVVGVLVMTGTFVGSAFVAQTVLSLTNAI